MKHLLLRSEGEHHRILVAVPLTPELLETIKTRGKLAKQMDEADNEFACLGFSFYGLDLHDQDTSSFDMDDLLGDGVDRGVVDELPEGLGDAERLDYGEMVFSSRDLLYFRFGIKHVPEIYETRAVSLTDVEVFPK